MAMNEVREDEKRKLIKLCCEYLSNDWCNVDLNDVFCAQVPYGLTNRNYHCYIKSKRNSSELNDVIIHMFNNGVFGEKSVMKHLGEAAEVAIMQRLYEIGMAPKLFAVFRGGRIEQYIPGKPASREDFASVELCKAVMRKLAAYHMQNSMPIYKEPHLIDKVYNVAMKVNMTNELIKKYSEESRNYCRLLIDFPYETEYKWIKQILPKLGHKLVFSHNDMNPNNILIRTEQKYQSIDEQILLIDYETSTYFYRGFDIAYFLVLKSYKIETDGKKVTIESAIVDDSIKDEILTEYLSAIRKLDNNNFDANYDNLEQIRMEVDFFNAICRFHLICLGRSIIAYSSYLFPMEFLATLAVEYETEKRNLMAKYGNPEEWK